MQRALMKHLLAWKDQANLKPLILRGARQVGKTYLVEEFAKSHFSHFLNVNFELQPEYLNCFESLDTNKIMPLLKAVSGQDIKAGQTLLFLDEIQECPNAIMALRYFKEQLPNLHVIAAGSLLEFCLNKAEFRMPVGRVQFLHLFPCSFQEYLRATGDEQLCEYLEIITVKEGVNKAIHQTAIEKFKNYMAVGGMPEVVANFAEHHDYNEVDIVQREILSAYQGDFGKYDSRLNVECVQAIYRKAPGMVAQNFKFSHVDPNMLARDLRPALGALKEAGLIYAVHATTAAGIPLAATRNEKKFKLLFLDIGLVRQATGLSSIAMLQQDLMLLNQGALTEQFVGQELLAYHVPDQKGELFYWERSQPSSTAEVDYVLQRDTQIIPVEVKSGKTGRLKSLKLFMQEKGSSLGVRISQHELNCENNILSIPLYLVHELPRLIQQAVN